MLIPREAGRDMEEDEELMGRDREDERGLEAPERDSGRDDAEDLRPKGRSIMPPYLDSFGVRSFAYTCKQQPLGAYLCSNLAVLDTDLSTARMNVSKLSTPPRSNPACFVCAIWILLRVSGFPLAVAESSASESPTSSIKSGFVLADPLPST